MGYDELGREEYVMKKILVVLLAAVLILALFGCGNDSGTSDVAASEETENAVLDKDEMLNSAVALTRDDIEKATDNKAFASSLVGNIYTFAGEINSIEEDHAVIFFYVNDDQGSMLYGTLYGDLYLPTDDLISMETEQKLWFVGKLDEVGSSNMQFYGGTSMDVPDLIFRDVAITGDRFESTGRLGTPNASYGSDAWNVFFFFFNVAYVVHFKDDVSSYEGKEIVFSYRDTSEGNVDAVIVE